MVTFVYVCRRHDGGHNKIGGGNVWSWKYEDYPAHCARLIYGRDGQFCQIDTNGGEREGDGIWELRDPGPCHCLDAVTCNKIRGYQIVLCPKIFCTQISWHSLFFLFLVLVATFSHRLTDIEQMNISNISNLHNLTMLEFKVYHYKCG